MEDHADIPSQKSDMIDESQEHVSHPIEAPNADVVIPEPNVIHQEPEVQKSSTEESTVMSEKI